MRTTHGDKYLQGAGAQRSGKLRALMSGWRRVLLHMRESLRSSARRQRRAASRRDGRAPGVNLTQPARGSRAPRPAERFPSVTDTREHKLVPPPDAVSHALEVLRDQLRQELNDAEVKGAEIRVIVHKRGHRSYPRLDLESKSGPAGGELALELRRLIACSGGTIADVAEALETHGSDLDESARELLRDEVEALEVDLAMLNVQLADPVNWDSEFERLLDGEVAPFDDPAGEEDDDND